MILNSKRGPLSILTYFRLKMSHTDGSFIYSKVLSVVSSKDLTVKVYPNPIHNELTIDINSESRKQQIDVFDVLGRTVFTQNTEGGVSNANLLKINTLDWQKGIYFLKITDGKTVFQQKVVKQ